VQITRTTPLRRITLHFTQIFFTEARTFTASSSRRKRPENHFPSVRTPYRGSRRRGLPGTKGARLITAALRHVKMLLAGRRAGHGGVTAPSKADRSDRSASRATHSSRRDSCCLPVRLQDDTPRVASFTRWQVVPRDGESSVRRGLEASRHRCGLTQRSDGMPVFDPGPAHRSDVHGRGRWADFGYPRRHEFGCAVPRRGRGREHQVCPKARSPSARSREGRAKAGAAFRLHASGQGPRRTVQPSGATFDQRR